ncbi:MAG: NUDIX domain-containing protein [Clostridiales bacterium]|nr:NUDIX domain-containing protein [Clostridiales bacterium]
MERKIRNSAKALVIKGGRMAAIKINDGGDVFYIMPGGGQNPEELLTETVIRECAEELGIAVSVKDLAFVIEGMHGEPFHRVDLVFLCEYVSDIPQAQLHGDTNQAGIEWLAVDGLESKPLYPSKLRKQIIDLYNSRQTSVYLGNENIGE